MKQRFFASLAALSLFTAGPAFSQSSSRIQQLKSQILAIASQNQEQLDNFPEVRASLDPLIGELATYQSLSSEESLERKLGGWRQIWTDDADDVRGNNLFVKVDRKQTYQVVLDGGTFYNVSVINLPFGIKFAAFLEGAYQAEEKLLNLEFTSLKLRLGGLNDVVNTVEQAENNTLLGLIPFPGGAKKPNGPVGAKGNISTVYIDDELSIDYGKNLDDGVKDLFILVRIPK
ncbi:MAG: hypothetical protein NTX25_12510 [Proteobacteria bacterium]|nr:hypothetical protein [Pseudomonadota bacterium]